MVALFAVATATVLTAPKVQQQVVSFIDDGLQFIGDTIKKAVQRRTSTLIITYAALNNVMMTKKKKPAEHRTNRHESNREKHQKGQERTRRDHGGERGDKRRTKNGRDYVIPKDKLKKIANSIVKDY